MYKVMVRYADVIATFAVCATFDAAVRMVDSLKLEAWVTDNQYPTPLYTNR